MISERNVYDAEPLSNRPPERAQSKAERFAMGLLMVRDSDTELRVSVRRALRPETEAFAMPYLAPVLSEMSPSWRVGATRAFGMMASCLNLQHRRSGSDENNRWVNRRFGWQLADAFRDSGRPIDPIGVRLATLSTLGVEEAAETTAGLLHRLDSTGRRFIDWIDLFWLMTKWEPNSQRASEPTFDYYSYKS